MTPVALFLILISPAVGSFLALLADRLPRGEDVISRRSACRACQTNLSVRDLVPVLSFVFLRGQCRTCAAEIPRQLVAIEIAAIIIAISMAYVAKSDLQLLLGCGFLWCLLALAASDATWFRLPDPLTIALLGLGLALAWEDPTRSITTAALTAILASAIFLVIRVTYKRLRDREGLGLGDVKLMAGIGAGTGLSLLPVVVLVAAFGGLAWGVLRARNPQHLLKADTAIPFGSFLATATALVWLYSQQMFV